ncbi:Hypothetical predicted protein [Mytilus galloprovincialis]|uniref:Kazal-like domain-containing protein n=1 Tax=Mytilus galloprovincialis TaxID=29158 RepID=A0A8B6DBM6_MYTGA|nr:Hypothetical predicted protein [Mytilus galloprovincialis]
MNYDFILVVLIIQVFVSPCNTRALTRYYCELADRINCRARDEARTCGSDGKTYYNMCALNIATCDHPRLHAVHSGPCPTSSTITDIPSVPTQDGLQAAYDIVCLDLFHHNCLLERSFQLCGSNKATYINLCEFDKARCTHRNLHVVKYGPC